MPDMGYFFDAAGIDFMFHGRNGSSVEESYGHQRGEGGRGISKGINHFF
jgi:hypothetical protein